MTTDRRRAPTRLRLKPLREQVMGITGARRRSMPRSLPFRPSLLLRSERYRRLDADPLIRSRTSFFAAASVVTRVLAYSGATPFMLTLSDALERANMARARQICTGLLYAGGSVERNTLDFVQYEQGLVQEALERLRRSDPTVHSEQIRIANRAIDRALRHRTACAFSALETFTQAAQACLARLGRTFEFSAQCDREALGQEIARSARRPEPARVAGVALQRLWP